MNTPKLIDVHTHTHFAAYGKDRDAVIRRALDAGIWMINVGVQKDTSTDAIKTTHDYEGIFATVGLHPVSIEESFFDYEYYKKLAEDSKVVAIGECGLDYYHLTEETKAQQAEVFKKQIELSFEIKKPLMIHCRDHGKLQEGESSGKAFADLISIFKEEKNKLLDNPGVIHFFSGTVEDAKELMDLGFLFSFGGALTFARAYEKLVKYIPLERIVLETDAPYVAPQAYRGKRNEPLYVEEVAKKIGRILGKDFEEVARITTENAIKVFGLK
ncbi:MAG: TatD family hydrolase [bacterium]|nr:TatD family hydrolase [bacterium]